MPEIFHDRRKRFPFYFQFFHFTDFTNKTGYFIAFRGMIPGKLGLAWREPEEPREPEELQEPREPRELHHENQKNQENHENY